MNQRCVKMRSGLVIFKLDDSKSDKLSLLAISGNPTREVSGMLGRKKKHVRERRNDSARFRAEAAPLEIRDSLKPVGTDPSPEKRAGTKRGRQQRRRRREDEEEEEEQEKKKKKQKGWSGGNEKRKKELKKRESQGN